MPRTNAGVGTASLYVAALLVLCAAPTPASALGGESVAKSAVIPLIDRVLRPGELRGTTRSTRPEIHRTLAGVGAWSPAVFGFPAAAATLRREGFRVAVTEPLRGSRESFDHVDSSAVELATPAAARRQAATVYRHWRNYAPDPLYDRVSARDVDVPGVTGARAVTLALSSRTDKTAHDRDYAVIFTDGLFLYTLFTDSPNADPAGHFRERDVLTAARSLYERVQGYAST